MSIEFMLVTFPEVRDVLANGNVVGKTNRTLLLAAHEYVVALSGTGYSPSEQDIVLAATSMQKPKVVAFTVAAATVAPRARPKAKAAAKVKTATKKKAGSPPPRGRRTKKKAGSPPPRGRRTKKTGSPPPRG
jgi:hypothetical protein